MEEHYLASHQITVDDETKTAKEALDTLGSFEFIEWETYAGVSIPSPNLGYFRMILKIMTWDFAFMMADIS